MLLFLVLCRARRYQDRFTGDEIGDHTRCRGHSARGKVDWPLEGQGACLHRQDAHSLRGKGNRYIQHFICVRPIDFSYDYIGLVDYVSEPGASALDRALKLAKTIAPNGMIVLAVPK